MQLILLLNIMYSIHTSKAILSPFLRFPVSEENSKLHKGASSMSNNPQFQRTDKAIMQAMVSLLKKKSFEKITVQDILDETPVTRATFYAHYHDKYEVVEKMLDQFLYGYGTTGEKIRAASPENFYDTARSTFLINREYAQALISVHTDRVDFTEAIVESHRKKYLAEHNSSTVKAEARIYAAARTALYLSFLEEDITDFAQEQINQILLSAVLALLNLPEDDTETRLFLQHKLMQASLAKR